MRLFFLTFSDIIHIHDDAIVDSGGGTGLRDKAVLNLLSLPHKPVILDKNNTQALLKKRRLFVLNR